MSIVKYNHHNRNVFVREDLKGKHRDYCLCFKCKAFTPDVEKANCRIARILFAVCETFNLVTPVWECPEFDEIK